jgi:hypothetical protein
MNESGLLLVRENVQEKESANLHAVPSGTVSSVPLW